ncbi:MAG: flagellar type III secretion system pore protein FliP [Alphaproteobacteria bacterium]|nr:flagellar type III secretion system pore protein FliP [Alphaproteobacteria bacterium]
MITTFRDFVSTKQYKGLCFGLLLLSLCVSSAYGDTFTLDLGDTGSSGSMMGRVIQIFLLITLISLAPAIVVVVTSFTRFVVVFSFLRSALGTQQSPPNMVLIALALFLTIFVMQPTLENVYTQAIDPLINGKIDEHEAFEKAAPPIKGFMLKNVREDDLRLFIDIANIPKIEEPLDTPLHALIPAFLISELRRSFEIGFLLFLPFLIIDLVVASVLMAMGMMMLPPVMISMPFKIIFFVLIDGWHMLCGSLIHSVRT